MSINRKILMMFGSILVLMLFVSGNFMYQLKTIDNDYTRVIDGLVPLMSEASNLSTTAVQGASYVQHYLVGDETAKADYNRFVEAIDETITYIAASRDSVIEAEVLEALQQTYTAYIEALNEAVALIDKDQPTEAARFLREHVTPLEKEMTNHTAAIEKQVQDMFYYANDFNGNITDETLVTSSIFVAVLIILIVICTLFFRRFVTKPIIRLNAAVSEVAKGKLNGEPVHITTNDELKHLADAFEQMKQSLRTMIQQLADHSDVVEEIADEMSGALTASTNESKHVSEQIQHVLKLAQNNVQGAHNSSATLEETSSGVQRIAEATQSLQEMAIDSAKCAVTGKASLHDVSTTMTHITTQTSETAKKMDVLFQQSDHITN
ncbi:MAG: methyl-accepting chemotaxis protein, partial [Caryophanon sp.]|nr:methyl-accepting chemotaxis protein [Caryophanon sp.]